MPLSLKDKTTWKPATKVGMNVLWKALLRLWGRDVMLYVGGVSFFAMLAVFPAVAILIGLYSLIATPEQAAQQAELVARMMPAGAESLFEGELQRLVAAPRPAISFQSILALTVGSYASHRGFKAMLAGLSFIHDEHRPHGFVSFNLMALVVLFAAFLMSAVVTAGFLAMQFARATLHIEPLQGFGFVFSEWTWTTIGLFIGLTLIYRYAMSRDRVIWRASMAGGVAAAFMFVTMSILSAIYVEQIIELGATYGSIATVVVLLIWLSWNVNAVFFGGALATEIELALHERKIPVEPQPPPD